LLFLKRNRTRQKGVHKQDATPGLVSSIRSLKKRGRSPKGRRVLGGRGRRRRKRMVGGPKCVPGWDQTQECKNQKEPTLGGEETRTSKNNKGKRENASSHKGGAETTYVTNNTEICGAQKAEPPRRLQRKTKPPGERETPPVAEKRPIF